MQFAILIFDEPDSAALRDQYRQSHLDYLKAFDDQTLFAGPFTTDDESADLGSLRLIEFADFAAAEKHVADEPYILGGVQKRWQIHRWSCASATTWRDCPRTNGNIQALFLGIDKHDCATIRSAHAQAHTAHRSRHADAIMCHGPILTDDGAAAAGDLMLLDIPDMAAAHAIVEDDPLVRAGCYRHVEFHRWRFGRVFDRYEV